MWQVLTRKIETARLAGIYPHVIRFAGLYESVNDRSGLAQVVAIITWCMPDHPSEPEHGEGISQQYMARPADTVLVLCEGQSLPSVEADILQMAWHLGDPMPTRLEKAPLADAARWQEPGYGITNDFGFGVYKIGFQLGGIKSDFSVGDVCDAVHPANLEHAAANGYIVMRVFPLAWTKPALRDTHLKRNQDSSLADDYTRVAMPIRCGTLRYPKAHGTGHEQQYEMRRKPKRHPM
jgi:hypothetical protein